MPESLSSSGPARAAAFSGLRAGLEPVFADLFADLDLLAGDREPSGGLSPRLS